MNPDTYTVSKAGSIVVYSAATTQLALGIKSSTQVPISVSVYISLISI